MDKETEKRLQKQIDQLEARLDQLSNNATIPFEVGEAFRARLFGLGSSTKTASSETQSVNEAGGSTYSVAKPMDGFLEAGDKRIPYYL